MDLYHIKSEDYFLITQLLKEVEKSKMNEFCMMCEYPNYLLFKGQNENKYKESSYKNLDIPIADEAWTSGGIGVFSPGSIVIGAISDSKETIVNLQTKIYDVLCKFLAPLEKFTIITRNDIEIDHRKISGCFIDETPQHQFVMGLYINDIAPNDLIAKVTTKLKRSGAGLSEFNLDKKIIIEEIENIFDNIIQNFDLEKIKRP